MTRAVSNEPITPLASNEYRCASCAGVFEKGWTNEEAEAERAMNGWESMADDDMALVCEDCYQKLMFSVERRTE